MAQQSGVHVSFPILKFDRTPDGDLVVYGKCTDGTVDADHQIVDPKWSAKALGDWLATGGNMRVQHSPFLYPAGKGLALELDRDGDTGHWLKALVVKDTPAHGLVEKGILKDFSIGILDPKIVFDSHAAPAGTIRGGKIGEVSLVDRGSNKNTTFQIAKSAGDGVELVAKMLSYSPMAVMAISKKKKKLVDSGGRDVSDVPDKDFAGPDHTFPVKTPADVPDAASLAHHADDPAQVRDNIKRIARRKFGDKTDMPPSLQDKEAVPDLVKEDAECKLCNGTGKIRDGNVDCPECKGKSAKPELVKGDASDDHPVPPEEEDDDSEDEPDDEDASNNSANAAKKAMKRAIRRQRKILKREAQRGNNGGDTPSAIMGHADPDTAVRGFTSAADKEMIPAGKHREPDGAQAEGLEHDAGMDSTEENGSKTGMPGSDWSASKSHPSYGMQRLHDAVCPGYRWGQVRKSYGLPKDVGAAVPVREIETLAMDALMKGNLDEAAYFTEMLNVASSMQHIGPDALIDARKALPSMFPNAHPAQRAEVRPSQFQGGYISAGHPALTADSSSGRSSIPNAQVHEVSASDFKRGFISSGHASASPDEGTQASASTARFGAALSSMAEMHSRVTSLWPGMCPVNVTERDYSTGEGNTGIKPSKMPSVAVAPGQNKMSAPDLNKALADASLQLAKLKVDIKNLEEENAMLAALPDPEQAPFRGLPQLDGPVDRESFVGKALGTGGADSEAEDDGAEFLEFVNGLAANGNPQTRVAATKAIVALLKK